MSKRQDDHGDDDVRQPLVPPAQVYDGGKDGQGSGDDEAVGYGCPPRKHQFQPGQSGNPKGRRRGSRNFKTDLKAVLEKRLSISIGGKTSKMSAQEALLNQLLAKALKGNIRPMSKMLDLAAAQSSDEADTAPGKTDRPHEDQDILRAYIKRRKPRSAAIKKRRQGKKKGT